MLLVDTTPVEDLKEKQKIDLVNFAMRDLVQPVTAEIDNIFDLQKVRKIYSEDTSLIQVSLLYSHQRVSYDIKITWFDSTNPEKALKSYLEDVKSIVTFYKSVNFKYQQKTTSFYHSRIIPFDPSATSALEMNKILIEIQENMGEDFVHSVVYQIVDYNFYRHEMIAKSQKIDGEQSEKQGENSKPYSSGLPSRTTLNQT